MSALVRRSLERKLLDARNALCACVGIALGMALVAQLFKAVFQ